MCALYSQTIRSVGNETEGAKARTIKNRILSDFYHHNDGNLYHDPYYDEPTYLSFRIAFNFENPSLNDNLNDMPMPLLDLSGKEIQDITGTSTLSYNKLAGSNFTAKTELQNSKKLSKYSTYNYLIEQKEYIRANYLNEFVSKLQDIENNYPFYFKSIEGINNLLKINTTSGRRLLDGENILTIKCLEGLDLKITELINLYRKIAWDDEYQRWILPDMMRFFQMKIYISEIRNFHLSTKSEQYAGKLKTRLGGNLANRSNTWGGRLLTKLENTQIVNKAMNIYDDVKSAIKSFSGEVTSNAFELINNSINNYMPTLCITCNQCEFMIDDMLSNFGSFTSNNKTALDDLTIKIKVGNIKESQYYPLDINELDSSNHLSIFDEELYRPTSLKWSSKETELGKLYGISQDRNYFGGEKFGKAYSEVDNGYVVFDQIKKKSLFDSVIMEVADKAIDSAIGHIDQKATELLNKGLNIKLGNTNLTVQGMLNALNSKNILTMYNYVRDSINTEMNTNNEIGSNAVSSNVNIESFKNIKNDVSLFTSVATSTTTSSNIFQGDSDFKIDKYNSEATLNLNDELDNSTRKQISNEYQSFKNNNSSYDSEATNNESIKTKGYDSNNVKHSEIGDQAFIDFLKTVAALPTSSATEDQKLAIEIAKIISDSDMTTKELDVFFAEAKAAEHEALLEIEKLKNEEKEINISGIDSIDIKKSTDIFGIDKPEDKTKKTNINGFSDQQDNYNKLPKSEAVENKEEQIILFDEYSDLQSQLRKLAFSSATDPNIKVSALKLYNILKNYIIDNNSNVSSKKAISDILDKNELSEYDRKTIIELYEIGGQEKDLSNLLKRIYNSSRNYEYNLLPKSEAVENLYSTNDMTKVEIKDNIENPSNIYGFNEQQDNYNKLPKSETIENLYSTNDMTKVEIKNIEKLNKINKFNLNNSISERSNKIDGYSELHNLSIEPPLSEATENLKDEMNSDKRNKLISEYSNLKNE